MSGWGAPQVARLAGDRLHLQHGPIDLVIKAEGSAADVKAAYTAAINRFDGVLLELVSELPLLRCPLESTPPAVQSPIAKTMVAACWPHRAVFITPMAAVAGSVADEIKAAMIQAAPGLASLYVNNGGDISIHVAEGASLKIGLVPDLVKAIPEGSVTIAHGSGIGGIATSGWRGRSFSRGIADAVTVLAESAAEADAAATVIANAVDVDDRSIQRVRASSLDPDSDLREILVTSDVGMLSQEPIDEALLAGESIARSLINGGQILAAALVLQDNWRLVDGRTGLLSPFL